MLIYQRQTFADDFLLRVLLPYLPIRAKRLLGVLGIWGRPAKLPRSQPSDKRIVAPIQPSLLRRRLARLAHRTPPAS